jgi:lipoprotein-anchoring transpeptidase ErfK/SrfK
MISGKRKIFKWLMIGLLSTFLAAATISVIIVSQRTLPNDDLKLARESLSAAKEADANIYAEKLFNESTQMYDNAMRFWSIENSKFILFRDYTNVILWAKRSRSKSEEAEEKSIKLADNLSKDVEAAFINLGKKIDLYNTLFKKLPLPRSVFDAHNKSKMFLSESKIAQESGKLKEAEILFKKADIYINHANTAAGKMLRDYFSGYGKWKNLVNNAIAASRGGNKVILVDKVAHILYVYQSGKVIRSYDAEFGPNWMAHKERAGDRATPEGTYHVTKKKDSGNSAYHKALLLDYPNAEDRNAFALKKKQGVLSRRTGIGNLIEIHGNGGRGFDWTSGCVGLRDRDIDELCRLVGVGTHVAIVGSIEPLSVVTKDVDF